MPRILALFLLAVALFLAGCAHPYRITTHDGQVYTAEDQPKFEEESKSYRFKLLDGKQVILNQSQVKEIKQED